MILIDKERLAEHNVLIQELREEEYEYDPEDDDEEEEEKEKEKEVVVEK